jgi:hypothetical protein
VSLHPHTLSHSSWPAPLQAFALVATPRLGLRHKTTSFYTLHWLKVINIKLHLYQSWVSCVSIHDNCHVVILIKCKSLKILIESIFKAPNVIILCTWLQHVGVYVCPFLGIHNYFFPLWKWWFQFGWASHPFANCWKFYKYLFLKNDGTTQQIFHLRFTYFTTLKKNLVVLCDVINLTSRILRPKWTNNHEHIVRDGWLGGHETLFHWMIR